MKWYLNVKRDCQLKEIFTKWTYIEKIYKIKF